VIWPIALGLLALVAACVPALLGYLRRERAAARPAA
jgi:hypothetical protein